MGCQESTLHGGVRGCTHVVERVEGQAFLLIQSAANGRGKNFQIYKQYLDTIRLIN